MRVLALLAGVVFTSVVFTSVVFTASISVATAHPANTHLQLQDVFPESQAHDWPPPVSFDAFTHELCDRWARVNFGNKDSYIAFFERSLSLKGTPASDEYPLRVLSDVQWVHCWRVSAELIGFVGDVQAASALLERFEAMRLRDLNAKSASEALRAIVIAAVAQNGLAFAAARLEAAPLRGAIIDHLTRSLDIEYWLGGARLSQISSDWYPDLHMGEARRLFAYEAVRHSLTALGHVGDPEVSTRLAAYNAIASGDPFWRPLVRDGVILRVSMSLASNAEIRRVGLSEYIRLYGADGPALDPRVR